jgi:ZIP family zinc transporter
MEGIWYVLLLSLLPGAGNFAGGMIAEFLKTTPRLLNLALHAASGIVIAIVSVELIPEALGALPAWWLAITFAAGGGAYLMMETLVERLQGGGVGEPRTGMWMIYVAVAVDLSSDGLMLGTGAAVSSGLGLVLAAGQVLADLPEGYATVANLREKGVPRRRRILLSASFFLFATGAALLSYLLLRGASEGAKMAALAFAAGLLTVAAVEDMLEEAHEARADNRLSVLAFVCGFALFTLVSAGLEALVGRGERPALDGSPAAERSGG